MRKLSLTNLPNEPICPLAIQNNSDLTAIKPLGIGSMAIVWLAKWKGSNDVAVKCLRTPTPHEQALLRDEAALMKELNSFYIVKSFGLFGDECTLHLILEPCNGGTLTEWLPRVCKRPSISQIELAAEIALGVSYLHDNKIIHFDIKPNNILFTEKDHIKITDFGLSLTEENALALPEESRSVRGSASWKAPEAQFSPYIVGYFNDVWSMSIIFGQIVTGDKVPFQCDNSGTHVKTYEQLHNVLKVNSLPNIDNAQPVFRNIIEAGRLRDHTARPSAKLIAGSLLVLLADLQKEPVATEANEAVPVASSIQYN